MKLGRYVDRGLSRCLVCSIYKEEEIEEIHQNNGLKQEKKTKVEKLNFNTCIN